MAIEPKFFQFPLKKIHEKSPQNAGLKNIIGLTIY
jgi:hypothetical protein